MFLFCFFPLNDIPNVVNYIPWDRSGGQTTALESGSKNLIPKDRGRMHPQSLAS
jgi:hypothetical protein